MPVQYSQLLLVALALVVCTADSARLLASEGCLLRVAEYSESIQKNAREADRRVVAFIRAHKNLPKSQPNQFSPMGINYSQWVGVSPYGPGKIRWHSSASAAWTSVLRLLEKEEINEDFDLIDKEEMIQLLKKKIFSSLPQHRKRMAAAKILIEFIDQHGRLPSWKNARGFNEFQEIGLNPNQFYGSGDFRMDGGKMKHKRLNDSRLKALMFLRSQLLALSPSDNPQIAKNRELALQQLDKEILLASGLSNNELAKVQDRKIIEFMKKNLRRPTGSTGGDFEKIGVDYKRWAGTGDYRPGKNRAAVSLHLNKVEAWKSIFHQLEVEPTDQEFTAERKEKVLQELAEYIDALQKNSAQLKEEWEEILVDFFIEFGRMPSTSQNGAEFRELGINHKRLFGWGDYREGAESGIYAHQQIHAARSEAYLAVLERLQNRQTDIDFSEEYKATRVEQLQALIDEIQPIEWRQSVYGVLTQSSD